MPLVTVATPCAAYNLMAADWDIIDALLGGTRKMREKQVLYLPKEPAELDVSYANRLSRSYLKPALRNAIESGKGAVFRYEVSVDEVNPQLQPLLEDVDLLGNDITAFLALALGDELSYGHCHLLAAYPTMSPGASLADAKAAKARPYGVRIDPRNVFSWRKTVVSGYEKIAEVRFFERVYEPTSEWDADTFTKNVTVLRPGEWQEWSNMVPATQPLSLDTSVVSAPEHHPFISGGNWQMIASGEISVPDVPWTTIYADRVDFMVSRPPFMDLAWLNLAHWQVYSDYKNILHVAQVPLLFCAGMAANDSDISFGISSAVRADDSAASMHWVELTGKSIESGRTELQDLEAAMEKLGAALLSEDKNPGNETATAVVMDTAQEQATLGGIVRGLEDGANAFLWHMGQWLGIEDAGKIRIRRPIGMGGVEGKAQVQDGQVIVEPKKEPPKRVTVRQGPAR